MRQCRFNGRLSFAPQQDGDISSAFSRSVSRVGLRCAGSWFQPCDPCPRPEAAARHGVGASLRAPSARPPRIGLTSCHVPAHGTGCHTNRWLVSSIVLWYFLLRTHDDGSVFLRSTLTPGARREAFGDHSRTRRCCVCACVSAECPLRVCPAPAHER